MKKKLLIFFISFLLSVSVISQSFGSQPNISRANETEEVRRFIQDEQNHLRNLERIRREGRTGVQNTQGQNQTTAPVIPVTRSTRENETPLNTRQTSETPSTFVKPDAKDIVTDNFQYIGLQIVAGGGKNNDYSFMTFQLGAIWANFFPTKSNLKLGIITQYYWEKRYVSGIHGFNYFSFDILFGLKIKSFFTGIGVSNKVCFKENSELNYGMKQYDILFAFRIGLIFNSKILISADLNIGSKLFLGHFSFGIGF